MKRQVVLIGVQKPGGGLQALRSIGKCITDMRDWAISQGIKPDDIKIFSDVPGFADPLIPVLSVNDIYKWIDDQAQSWQPADQLLIYFSGHGMLSGGATLWLLPQAPDKAWEAVNLDSSKELAVWSKFGHVVFIGDCCATVADDEQFDMVRGAPILRNVASQERITDKPVDLLKAARPGKASLEVTVNGVSLSPYTELLVTALAGDPSSILEVETPGTQQPLVLRLRKLADQLKLSVNTYLRSVGVTPAAPPLDYVVSTTQWISLFPTLPLPPQPPAKIDPPPVGAPPPSDGDSGQNPAGDGDSGVPSRVPDGTQVPAITTLEVKDVSFTIPAMQAPAFGDGSEFQTTSIVSSLDSDLLGLANGSIKSALGQDWSSAIPDGYHYETRCGFYITGGLVVSAETRRRVEHSSFPTSEVKIDTEEMELVALEFENGGGVMLPAIAGQIGFIHMEGGRLQSLAYEPSGNADPNQKSTHRQEFENISDRVRKLRDTLRNVVASGDLSFADVSPETVSDILSNTDYASKLDFSSLLYLGYLAYASQTTRQGIPVLARYTQRIFGFVPFDFKILLDLSQVEIPPHLDFAPPFPLLTQGWSLLQATHEDLPQMLEELPEHYRNAAWTQFDAAGLELCRAYLEQQEESGSQGGGGAAITATEAPAIAIPPMQSSHWFERAMERGSLHSTAYASADDDDQQEMTTSADW